MASSTGTSIAANTYDEYGIPEPRNQGRFQYTGQIMLPELGMYHYKARIYSPTLGRFLQTDPIGYDDQINLYAYVGNDPVNATDPSGTERCPDGSDDICATAHRPALIINVFIPGTPENEAWATAMARSTERAFRDLKGWMGSVLASEAIDVTDPESVEGKTPEEVEEAAKEAGFTESKPSDTLGGKVLNKPGNKADQIRIMPGAPNRSDALKRGPYVIISIGGRRSTVPLAGNSARGAR